MNAKIVNIIDLLKDERCSYSLPLFQRYYAWKKEQIEVLFNDIIKTNRTKRNHFIGTLVAIKSGGGIGETTKYQLIDGQQRISTLYILIIALYHQLLNHNKQDMFQLNTNTENKLLVEQMIYFKNKLKKLNLAETDDEIIDKILNDQIKLINNQEHKILVAYKTLSELIQQSNLNINEILIALKRINFSFLETDENSIDDDPQDIYESLNGKGLELSQWELIKNSFLINLIDKNEQEKIYKRYWSQIESVLDAKSNPDTVTRFFKDALNYLTFKTPKDNEINKIFNEYRHNKITNEKESRENFSLRFLKLSQIYSEIINFTHRDKKINQLLKEIEQISKVMRPTLIYIFKKLDDHILIDDEVVELLNMILSLLIRRIVAEIPSNGLNKIFGSLFFSYLNTIEDKDNNLFEVIKNFILEKAINRDDVLKIKDESIIHKLKTINFYKKPFAKFILKKLELNNNKNRMDLDNTSLQIEHIMPKAIDESWQKELGENWEEVHHKYLNTLGNLTFTNFNSEMSNSSFQAKLHSSGGFKDSGFKLNKSIITLENWNEVTITERSELLGKEFCEIFPLDVSSNFDLKSFEYNNNQEENFNYKWSDEIRSLYYEIKNNYFNNEFNLTTNKLYVTWKKDNKPLLQIEILKNALDIFINVSDINLVPKILNCRDYTNIGNRPSNKFKIHFSKDDDNINEKITELFSFLL